LIQNLNRWINLIVELFNSKSSEKRCRKESDDSTRKRLDLIEGEIIKLEREYADLEEVLKAEKAAVQGSAQIKAEIDKLRLEMAELQRRGQFDKLAEIQYGRLPELEGRLESRRRCREGCGSRRGRPPTTFANRSRR
jgi:ATP-dependent Clp protease ATP-binding subunit ClpB